MDGYVLNLEMIKQLIVATHNAAGAANSADEFEEMMELNIKLKKLIGDN